MPIPASWPAPLPWFPTTLTEEKAVSVTIYGIKNCDTMKKARTWLDDHGVAYEFHDYKAAAIDRPRLEGWVKELGWEPVLRRAGPAFRALPDGAKQAVGGDTAVALMLEQPAMIERPMRGLGRGR